MTATDMIATGTADKDHVDADGGPWMLHATLVARGGTGVLLRGPSASGKSDLGLRLIDRGALLVADDQVRLRVEEGRLIGSAPAALRGLIEVRGLGILSLPVEDHATVALVIDLDMAARIPRLPTRDRLMLHGIGVPRLRLNAFEASTPIKIELALADPAAIGREGRHD